MGKAVKAIVGIAITAVGFVTGNAALFLAGLSITQSGLKQALGPSVRSTLTPFDPKSINPDPASPRKLVFGQTTFPVDLRYAEPSGTNQEYIDYIFALAAHKSDAISEIYIEDDLAWTVGGGAQGKYVGYLTVEVILEAGSGAYHTVNAGTIWGSSTRMTGCTTMKVRVKRSDNSKTSQSPFSSGINGRWAVIGRGIPVYDPALDSTVPYGPTLNLDFINQTYAAGSGTQRAANQTTWAYTAGTARGNNPALQLLTYLLGWRIGGVVSVGCGLPVDTIDLPSFAIAAALCDESVALAAGGSQRRYEAGRAFADSDDPLAVIRTLLDAMNGELVDDGGRLSLRLAVNDLTPSFTITDDDFVSGYSWKPAAPIEQQHTVVRGRYSAPGATLYGLVDYPEVAIARTSIAPRPLTLELSAVQDPRRAERIAKQAAQRNLYQGTFAVTLGVRGWLLRRNMVVAVTSYARGWTAKLFRVRSLGFNADATVEVVLREENAAIYAWSASESAQVTPVAPVVFDSRAAASWLMADIEPGADVTSANTSANSNALGGTPAATVATNITTAGTTALWPSVTGTGRPADYADVTADALVTLRRGDWQSGVTYLRGQSVVRNRSSYVSLVNHSSSAGNGPPGANWGLVADGGVDGTNGTNGANGAPGANGTNGTNGTPGTNGIDGIDGIDGKLVEFIWRRAASVPATPTGNGIPAGWSDNPPAGSDPLWMSRGKQELDGTLIGTWSAPIRHDGPPGATGATGPAGANGANGAPGATGATGATGAQGPTGVAAPPIKSLSTGAAQLDPIRLVNGQTVTAAAELYLNTGGVSGVCSLTLQISESGAGSWATMTSGTVTDSQPTSEAVELVITGATFTNSGADRLFDIRAISTRQSRSVNVPLSYVRVI